MLPGPQPGRHMTADVMQTTRIVNWDLHALRTQPSHLFDANIV